MNTETFYWHYGGTNVQFACSQTEWVPTPMTYDGGVWYVEMELKPGMCEYKFIVDGEWCYDMSKEIIDDNFGGKNNIIIVQEDTYHKVSKKMTESTKYPFNGYSNNIQESFTVPTYPISDMGIPNRFGANFGPHFDNMNAMRNFVKSQEMKYGFPSVSVQW